LNRAAVVVPLYRAELTPEERLSLHHLRHYLREPDRIVVTPRSLRPALPDFERRPFDDSHFASVNAYSHLLLSPAFYKAFADYDYILIYQLDALVFSDQLEHWCGAGYDYIGAPWFKSHYDASSGFSRVGNGGFSLRRVRAFLDVLKSTHVPGWLDALTAPLPDVSALDLRKRASTMREARRGVHWYTQHYTLNEDHFWADRARLFDPGFRIAPVRDALRFAFENAPRTCFEANDNVLPFGCHAWAKWDRTFWEPYLMSA
jgi:hypothetical protein